MRALSHIRRTLVALCALAALGVAASAQSFPPLTGRVVDAAGVVDPSTRAALTAKLAALEAQSSDQLVVATVASLQGETIESYATALFRAWRLGQAGRNNGVLLLVAPSERKVRIEVGYGLEATLTDVVARTIIEQSIVPRFRADDVAGGIAQATDDIVQVLTGDAAQWQRRAAAAGEHRIVIPLPGWAFVLVAILLCAPFVIFFGAMGWVVLGLVLTPIVRLLVLVRVLPKHRDRQGRWTWLDRFDDGVPLFAPLLAHKPARAVARSRSGRGASRSSDWSSGNSTSSDSFSGGGGSSGGGGASGSW